MSSFDLTGIMGKKVKGKSFFTMKEAQGTVVAGRVEETTITLFIINEKSNCLDCLFLNFQTYSEGKRIEVINPQ